jgi:hypothetical protein
MEYVRHTGDREAENGLLDDEGGLIIPLVLYPLDRGRFSELETNFVKVTMRRQWRDVSSKIRNAYVRTEQVRGITEDMIDVLSSLQQLARNAAPEVKSIKPVLTIVEIETGLEWSPLSSKEYLIQDADEYIKTLPSNRDRPWRLPTCRELESLVEVSALDPDPRANPYPLRQPFNSQRFGYLLSGEVVLGNPPDATYIMNVSNGHIFNGYGNKCYVRAVRTARIPASTRLEA